MEVHSPILIEEMTTLGSTQIKSLTQLLVSLVDDDASVGFITPLSKPMARQYWEGVLDTSRVLWVATCNKVICGTIQLHLEQKQNGIHRAEIAKLMVHPDYQRRGIARQLMQVAEEKAIAEDRVLIVLDTREGDPSNLLYQSLDYIEAGKIPNYARSSDGQLESTVMYYKQL